MAERVHRRSRPLCRLLLSLGALALIFSAISPADDLVQQEFVRGQSNTAKPVFIRARLDKDSAHTFLTIVAFFPLSANRVRVTAAWATNLPFSRRTLV